MIAVAQLNKHKGFTLLEVMAIVAVLVVVTKIMLIEIIVTKGIADHKLPPLYVLVYDTGTYKFKLKLTFFLTGF